jgi:hypothetical protein
LADAITAANVAPDADTIVLAPGHFASGPAATYETHIIGAGEAATFIDAGATYGMKLDHAASSVSDLDIHAAPGGATIGLYLAGSAERVTVDLHDNPVDSSTAVSLHDDGSFVDGEALNSLATTYADDGISISGTGNALVSGVQVQGRYGIRTSGAGSKTIRFARVRSDIYGVNAGAEETVLDDSVVIGGPVVAYTGLGATTDILARVRHVTINGSYVGVSSGHDGLTAHLVASNVAVVGGGPDPETPDVSVKAFGTAVGTLDVSYSFFRLAHALPGGGGGTENLNLGAGNVNGAYARVVDISHSDLRLLFDSPLIDAGDPVPGGGEPMADVVGEFRAVNGRTDIGAYEYGRHTPAISAGPSVLSARVGEPVPYGASVRDDDPAESPNVTWTFDDGATATGWTAAHAFSTPGTHTATATATDPVGLKATASVAVTIAAPILPSAQAPAFGFKKLKARKGVVAVVLSCPVLATDCSGTIEVRLAPKPKAKAMGVAAKTIVLGKARYAIAHGARKTIKLKLNRSARKRLKRARHGLFVKVVAKPKGAASRSKTVRLTGR